MNNNLSASATMQETLISWLVGLSMYLLLFSSLDNSLGTAMQLVSIGLNVCAAILGLGRAMAVRDTSLYEFALVIACFASFITSTIEQMESGSEAIAYVVQYTGLATLTMIAVFINARHIMPETFFKLAGLAAAASVVTIYLVYPGDIFASVTAGSADKWHLRFVAFNLHPNLEGLLFGADAILIFYISIKFPHFAWPLRGLAVAAVALIFGASARAGLLALALAAGIALLLNFRLLHPTVRKSIIGLIGLGIFAVLIFGEQIWAFLVTMLELDSKTRGLDSGGSGRFDVWQMGLDLIGSSFKLIMLGGGFRWSNEDNIGFYTENSYITILLDSGIVVGGIIIYSMFNAVYKAGRNVYSTNLDKEALLLFVLILYGLLQSFFNRYLMAIGNPFSLVLIYLFTYGSSERLKKLRTQVKGKVLYLHVPRSIKIITRPVGKPSANPAPSPDRP